MLAGCEGRDKSWGDLLSEIAFLAHDATDNSLPMPIDYDRVLAGIRENRDQLIEYYSSREGLNDLWRQALLEHDLEAGIKHYICDWLNERSYCAPEMLDLALSEDFDFVLSSNYDLRIESRLCATKGAVNKKPQIDALTTESNSLLVAPKKFGYVGHVHGSIDDWGSIVIGQSDYLGSADAIRRVIDGWDGSPLTGDLIEWPLLFLGTDVFILGFGFSLDEIDLWALLHSRVVWFTEHPKYERNRIRYYSLYSSGGPSLRVSNPRQYRLFASYGVEVIDVPVYRGDYEDAYRSAVDLMKDILLAEHRSE